MLDIRDCDLEPIHVPGAIQPHGVLVAVDPRTLEILQVSANSAAFFSIEPNTALGRPLSFLIGHDNAAMIGAAPSEQLRFEANGAPFDAFVHRHAGVMIVEIERLSPRSASIDIELRRALIALQRPNSVRELCAIAVETVRALTGFDRVMMYRFGADGHGDVVEESKVANAMSYRGQHFPASDIPRQARELYILNWLRLIPNATYTPIALVKDRNAPTLDLSFATLRSVSPVHLEYLRNMDVAASMSVSVVSAGTLWGLIACHHRTPRHVDFATRTVCEVVGRVVALQIAAQEALELRRVRDGLRGIEASLVEAMRAKRDDVATALALSGDALLQLVNAKGAAICTDGTIRIIGATPAMNEIAALVSWLTTSGGDYVLRTDSLGMLHPPAIAYAHVASSVLAMRLPHSAASFVLWFRPEIIQTVTWAGDPVKAVTTSDHRISPRRSFEAWTEIVRGRGEPWQRAEIDAAEDLRRRCVEVDLGTQIERAERAVRQRDDMVAVVSHDLKSPLQVIGMSASVLQLTLAGNESALASVARIDRASTQMTTLIHDLLDMATIESGRFTVNLTRCTTRSLIADAVAMLAPLVEHKGIRFEWSSDQETSVFADPERVFQVFSNLVSNAVKFTPPGGSITIEARSEPGVVWFSVRDTGSGLEPTQVAHIFDRYWQAQRSRNAGSGLGLYIAKGIVEAHGQRIWVESVQGFGATFFFTLRSAD